MNPEIYSPDFWRNCSSRGTGTSGNPTRRRIDEMVSHINKRKDLTSGTKLLAWAMLDRYDPALGYIEGTRADLKDWIHGSIRGISRSIQALHKAGVIVKVQTGRAASRYYPRFSLVLDPETGELK